MTVSWQQTLVLRPSEAISGVSVSPFLLPCLCACSSFPQNALFPYPVWKTSIPTSIFQSKAIFLGRGRGGRGRAEQMSAVSLCWTSIPSPGTTSTSSRNLSHTRPYPLDHIPSFIHSTHVHQVPGQLVGIQ